MIAASPSIHFTAMPSLDATLCQHMPVSQLITFTSLPPLDVSQFPPASLLSIMESQQPSTTQLLHLHQHTSQLFHLWMLLFDSTISQSAFLSHIIALSGCQQHSSSHHTITGFFWIFAHHHIPCMHAYACQVLLMF